MADAHFLQRLRDRRNDVSHLVRVDGAEIATAELVRYLDDYLEAGATPDYGPNGLQVEGAAVVRRLVTGGGMSVTVANDS